MDDASLDRRLFTFSLLLHGAAQMTILINWSSLPPSERAQRLGSVAWLAVFPLLAACAPRLYLRHRTAVLSVQRIVFFVFPLLRQPRGIQSVLDSEPQPGLRGALKDMLRIIWGARLFTVFMTPLVTPLTMLPLVPQLALQIFAVLMVRNNSSLCHAPLLSHPLTADRIRGLHSALRLTAAVLPGGAGQALNIMVPVRAPSPQAQCEAYLHIVSFWVGLVLPLCLLIKTEPAESLKTWEVAWEAHQTEWQSARQPSGPADTSRHLGMVSEACMRQLAGRSWLAPAAATSTQAQRRWRQIYELAWWERCMSWWALLAFSWLISTTLG